MKVLLNNAHYVVTSQYSVNANGGANPNGTTVLIRQKRTNDSVEIPLNVWRKIAAAVNNAGIS